MLCKIGKCIKVLTVCFLAMDKHISFKRRMGDACENEPQVKKAEENLQT